MAIKLNNGTVLYVDKIAGSADEDNGSVDFTNGTSVSCRYGCSIISGGAIELESSNNIECTTYSGKLLYNDKEVATQEWVNNKNYINSSALNGYATQEWVLDQGYSQGSTEIGDVIYVQSVTSKTDTDEGSISFSYNNGIEIGGRYGIKIYDGEGQRPVQIFGLNNDIKCVTDGGNRLLYNDAEVATQDWVNNKNYVTSSALNGYATQTWVNNKNYITSSVNNLTNYYTKTEIDNKNYINSSVNNLTNYYTKSEVDNKNYLSISNDVWAHSSNLTIRAGWANETENDATLTLRAYRGIVLDGGAEDVQVECDGNLTINGEAVATSADLNGKLKRGSYDRIQGTAEQHKNLNDYTAAGFYNVKTAFVDNVPAGIGVDATLLVYPWDTVGYECQEITETAASVLNRRWVRKRNANTWSEWKAIFSVDNIDAYLSNRYYAQSSALYNVPELYSPDGDQGIIYSSDRCSIFSRYEMRIASGESSYDFILESQGNLFLNASNTYEDGKGNIYLTCNNAFINDESIATQSWVTNKNYATQNWVTQKGYWVYDSSKLRVDELEGYSDSDQGGIRFDSNGMSLFTRYNMNITSGESTYNLNLNSYGNINIHADNDSEADKGNIYLKCTNAYINNNLIATQTWINNQNYATRSWVENKNYATQDWMTSIAKPFQISGIDTYYVVGQTWRSWSTSTFCTILCWGDVHLGEGSDGREYICYQGTPIEESDRYLADSYIVE